jgi:hypothetical protein
MKINLLNNILVSFFGIVICFSCITIKDVEDGKIVKVLHEKKLLDSIKAHETNVEWLKARGNSIIAVNQDEEQEVEINIRSKIDSIIWINITKFKKKIYRGYFKENYLKMTIDYPEKLYYTGSLEELEKDINISLSYDLLQELIVGGSYMNYMDNKFILQVKDNEYHLLSHRRRKTKRITNNKTKKTADYIYQSWIDPFTYKCKRIKIIYPLSGSEINITYKNWKDIENQIVPMDIELMVNNLNANYKLKIHYKNIKFNLPQKFPFNYVKGDYKSINLNE